MKLSIKNLKPRKDLRAVIQIVQQRSNVKLL